MNGKNGTTLTETMVAITIIAFMLAPLFNLFATFSSRGKRDQKRIQALFYGQGILEIIKAMSSKSGISWIGSFYFNLSQHHRIPFEKWQYFKAGDLEGLPPSPFFFFDSATCDSCAERFIPSVEASGRPHMKERLKKFSLQEILANDSKYDNEKFWFNLPFRDFRFIVFLLPSKHFLNPDEEKKLVELQKAKKISRFTSIADVNLQNRFSFSRKEKVVWKVGDLVSLGEKRINDQFSKSKTENFQKARNDSALTEPTRFIVEVWVLWKFGGKQELIKISCDIETKSNEGNVWRKEELRSVTSSAKIVRE